MPGCVAAMRARGPRMWMSWWPLALAALLAVMLPLPPSSAMLSPDGTNHEVVALMAIKAELEDPRGVLDNWAIIYADPCLWRMVTCSSDGYVSALILTSQSLSGNLSPAIGDLTRIQSLLLRDNSISGPIPGTIGRLEMLETVDMSDKQLTGSIPSSLGNLKNLNYLDLSLNNLSGPLPKISARTFNISGNPMICGDKSRYNCSFVSPGPLSSPPDDMKNQPQQGTGKSHHVAPTTICGAIVGSIAFVLL